jgi:cytochrome d ubiquinol oxidase subunit I
VLATGDIQGKLFTTSYQPMKMAAAEALFHTAQPAPFSLLTIGNLAGTRPVFEVTLPRLLSFLATGNWNGRVQGIDNLQQAYAARFGPGSYVPIVPVIYWSFRAMIAAGLIAALIALVALWAVRRGRTPNSRTAMWAAIVMPFLPLAGNSFGWIVTEMGRQPWLVYGQMRTSAGVSPNSAGEVLASLIVFTLLYGVLAVIEAGLMLKTIRAGLPAAGPPPAAAGQAGPGQTGPAQTGSPGQDSTMSLVY